MDVASAIRDRKTVKVLAHESALLPPEQKPDIHSGTIGELLALAGWAPFHRACDEMHRVGQQRLPGIEPWRFHVLLAEDCRDLVPVLPAEKAGKIPAMLSAADAMLLATWLPNPASEEFTPTEQARFEPTLANMEHIAAASAAIQNLLLAATERGVSNYWSSGGVLRTFAMPLLGIPSEEILLGALFLFPSDTKHAEVVGSKLRDKRTSSLAWARHCHVRER